jgi:hypothetical protein
MPKSKCQHRSYPTSITAVKAAKQAGGKGVFREVEKCKSCQKWRVKEGLV